MNSKVAVGIALGVVALIGAYVVAKKHHSQPAITATLRVTVTPGEQLNYVADRANSAMFKYMIGKEAHFSPALARTLEVKPVNGTAMLEAKVAVMNRDEGQRFTNTFVGALQGLCGNQVQLAVAEQSVC